MLQASPTAPLPGSPPSDAPTSTVGSAGNPKGSNLTVRCDLRDILDHMEDSFSRVVQYDSAKQTIQAGKMFSTVSNIPKTSSCSFTDISINRQR